MNLALHLIRQRSDTVPVTSESVPGRELCDSPQTKLKQGVIEKVSGLHPKSVSAGDMQLCTTGKRVWEQTEGQRMSWQQIGLPTALASRH